MASFSEAELQQACSLLAAEFPDTRRNVLESVLRECDLELPVARRKLLELQPQAPSQQTGASYSGSAVRRRRRLLQASDSVIHHYRPCKQRQPASQLARC